MTVAEQIVAIAIALILSAGSLAVSVAAYRAGSFGSALTEAAGAARVIASAIARDTRVASSASCAQNLLVLSGPSGDASYTYLPQTATLLRNGRPYPYRVVQASWTCSGRLVSGNITIEVRRGLRAYRSAATFASLMRVSP